MLVHGWHCGRVVSEGSIGKGPVSLLAVAPSKSGTVNVAKPPRHHGDELFVPVALDSVSKLQ